MIKQEYKPYTYIIGWRTHNVWYYGSESAKITKNAHPDNLWTAYFTSSDLVSQFRQEHGEPDVVKVVKTFESADQAREAETKYLTRINAAERANWLNQHNGTDKFHTSGLKIITNGKSNKAIDPAKGIPYGWWYGWDEKTTQKKRAAILKRETHFPPHAYTRWKEVIDSSKVCNNGQIQKLFPKDDLLPPGWHIGQLPQKTEAHRQRLLGSKLNETTKEKIGLQHEGDKWFNNGIAEIHAKECPDGWTTGRLPITDQARKNRSISHKGLMWFTNGDLNKQFRSEAEVPEGCRRGITLPPIKRPRKSRSTKWFWITNGTVDKQHVVDQPIPEGFIKGKSKVYRGTKKRKEDLTIYTLYHPKHGEVSGTKRYFEETWKISSGKFSRMKRVTKKNPYGWRMVK